MKYHSRIHGVVGGTIANQFFPAEDDRPAFWTTILTVFDKEGNESTITLFADQPVPFSRKEEKAA